MLRLFITVTCLVDQEKEIVKNIGCDIAIFEHLGRIFTNI
jgi:hypothetical protein